MGIMTRSVQTQGMRIFTSLALCRGGVTDWNLGDLVDVYTVAHIEVTDPVTV